MRTFAISFATLIVSLTMMDGDAEAGIFGRRHCRRCPPCCRSSSPIPRSSSELQAQIIQLQNIIQGQQALINDHEQRVRQLESEKSSNQAPAR